MKWDDVKIEMSKKHKLEWDQYFVVNKILKKGNKNSDGR